MDQVTFSAITKSLDMLLVRQNYIAQNIANVNSAEYSAVRVQFEEALISAIHTNETEQVNNVRVEVNQDLRSLEENVRLDLELAEAKKTSMRYSALSEVLSRHFSISRSAIGSGR